jgi:GH15 family glucan-1,4-alpha-glucosidase
MAWVAIDRAIKTVEKCGTEGPIDRWKAVREEIHTQVCDEGFDVAKGSFTQYYGSDQLDASLLMIPLVGFLPATDPRVRGTIEAVERELVDGGFVLRYRTEDTGHVDGLVGREGAFLACSFWLADCLSMIGRHHDAHELFDRLLGLRNDLGLLSEEYDPVAGRLVGNFPQAFSHVSLVNTASKLAGQAKPGSNPELLGAARRAMTRSTSGLGRQHRSGHVVRRALASRPPRAVETDSAAIAGTATAAAIDAGGKAGATSKATKGKS